MYLPTTLKHIIFDTTESVMLASPLRHYRANSQSFDERSAGEPSLMSFPGDVSLLVRHPRIWWARLSLVGQFTLVSSGVAILGMLIQGAWVASTIKESVTYNSGAAAALYMESFIAPHVRGISEGEWLSQETEREIDKVMQLAS